MRKQLPELKILRRGGQPFNTMVFCFLSVLFIHFLLAKLMNVSGLSYDAFQSNLLIDSVLLIFANITAYSIYRFKRYSSILLAIFNALVWATLMWIIYKSQIDKFLLGLSFFYVLISFYFYLLWSHEMELACYRPKFSLRDLDLNPLIKIPVKLVADKALAEGVLTNWDDHSCFVLINSGKVDSQNELEAKLQFRGRDFTFRAQIHCHYGDFLGLGLKFKSEHKNKYEHWNHFFEILHERGWIEDSIH